MDEKSIRFIEFIEERYECSGLCKPPLFYLTQSVKSGPPKRGCLPPFADEFGATFTDLGVVMTVSGVFFFL